MWKIILIVAVVIILAGIGVTSAANAAVPGDLLYGLDRGVESLRLAITSNPQSVKSLQNQYLQERQAEIKVLAGRGDAASVEQAVQSLNQEMEAASQKSTSPGDSIKDKNAYGPKAEQNKEQNNEQNKEQNREQNEKDDPKEPNQGEYCNGTAEKNHPSGEKLASEYGVGYDEIMGWFCQGYGFGEVDLAYRISKQAGVPVSEVFALRAGGMGWGEILQKYGLAGKPDKDKGKPADKKNKP